MGTPGAKTGMSRGWDVSTVVVELLTASVGVLADTTEPSTALKRQRSGIPPATLAGREILLAYQILRC